MAFAIAFTVVLGLLVVFQAALAFGAPWGRLAWGGQHPRVLPVRYRVGSAVAVVVYVLVALLALDRAGLVDVVPEAASLAGMWIVFALLALGTAMNAFSRSRAERFAMTPVTLLLTVLALVVALIGPQPRAFEGMVLDEGEGPRFCTLILESYPPQCGRGSPRVAAWDWDAVTHERQGSIRWGMYRFEGLQDSGTITVVSEPRLR